MLTFTDLKKDPHIHEYIRQTAEYMKFLGFTDHGFKHVTVVAERAAPDFLDMSS